MDKLNIKKEYILLALILLLGAFLRFDGLSRALPVQFHPDSYITVDNAVRFMHFDFNYDRPFAWPAASIIHGYGIILFVINLFVPVTTLIAVKTIQYGNAITGIISILLVFFAARKMYNTRTALISSLLFSVMMFHIQFSRNETADSLAIFVMIASLYYIWKIASTSNQSKDNRSGKHDLSYMGYTNDNGKLRINKDMMIIGALLGLGFVTKYTDLIMALPLLIAMLCKYDLFRKIFREKRIDMISLRGFIQSGIIIALSALVVVIIVAPHIASHPVEFLTGMKAEQSIHQGRHGLAATNGMTLIDMEMSVFQYLAWGFGFPLAILSILSLLFALYRHDKRDIIISALVLVYCLFIGSYPLRLVRYFVPMFPFFAIMIGSMFDYSLDKFRQKWQNYLIYLILSVVFIYSFWYSMAYVNVYAGEDVRVIAGEWMDQNMAPGSQINFGPRINLWMMPAVDYSRYNMSQTPEYLILSKAAYYNIVRLLETPDIYKKSDWGSQYPTQEELSFYDIVYHEKGPYKLVKSFTKTPEFMGFKVDETNAEYTVWGITHPEIRIYKLQASGASK